MKKKLIILVLFVFLLSLGVTFRSNVKSVILNSNNNLYKDANTGKKLYEIIKSLSKGTDVSNSINYSAVNESGVFETKEDESSVYFYRGAIDNNNVIFGGKCWLILRTTAEN